MLVVFSRRYIMCLNHFHHRYVEKEPSDGRVRPVCDKSLAFYHNDHDGEHFVWLRFSSSIVISCVVVWRRFGITGTSKGARLVCQFAGRGTSLKEKFAHSRWVLGVFVESFCSLFSRTVQVNFVKLLNILYFVNLFKILLQFLVSRTA